MIKGSRLFTIAASPKKIVLGGWNPSRCESQDPRAGEGRHESSLRHS